MIQILSVTPDSAASPGLPGLPSAGAVPASFMAVMAEALMAKAGGLGQAEAGVLSARPAGPVVMADAQPTAGVSAGEGEASAAGAALLAWLAGDKLPLPGKPAAALPGDGDPPEDGGELTAAPDEASAAQPVPDTAAPLLLAMPGLPVPAEAAPPAASATSVPPAVLPAAMVAAVPNVPAVPGAAAQAPLPEAEPAALAVEVDSQGSGKKLPHQMAVLAGQQKFEPAKAGPEVPPGGSLPTAAPDLPEATEEVAVPALGPLAAAATPDKTPAAAILPAPAPVSGHEAALQGVRQHAAAAPQDRVQIGMQSGFGTAAWQQELGDKMVWMAGRQGQMAELVLNPPSLGAVEVRLNLSGGEASAQFFSANPNVRDVIEAALPRLREMMGSAGIALGEAMVSDQSFGQRDPSGTQKGGGQGAEIALTDDGMTITLERRAGTALLDYFA